MSAESEEDAGIDVVDGDPDNDDDHIFSDGFRHRVPSTDEHCHIGRRQIHPSTHRAARGRMEELFWKPCPKQ